MPLFSIFRGMFPYFFSYKNKVPVSYQTARLGVGKARIEMTRVCNRGSGIGNMVMLLIPIEEVGNDGWLFLRIRCWLSGLKGSLQ
jgi:hypothetical protein